MNAEIRFEPFDQIAALINAFAGFQDDLSQKMQQSMAQLQEGVDQMARQFAAGMAEYERVEGEKFKLVCKGGWLGMERHFTSEFLLAALEVQERSGEAAMNDAIGGLFNAKDSALLVAMTEEWARIPYLFDRQAIVRDAMSAHRAGQFTLSIPALLPLAEGLCAEILDSNATNVVKPLARDWHSRENEVWVQLFHDIVEDVIYKTYAFGKDPAPYLNRNGILHGRVPDYASQHNSTRVFLLIDTVADRWHEKQRTLSP